MPRFQSKSRGRSKRQAACALLLAASVLALTASMPVKAQELDLRGDVSEATIQRDRMPNAGKSRAARSPSKSAPADAAGQAYSPTPAYVPKSTGALPDMTNTATATGNIAPSANDDSAFSDNPAPLPKSPPWRPRQNDDQDETASIRSGKKPAQNRAGKARTAATTDEADAMDVGQDEARVQPANQRVKTIGSDERQSLDLGAERTGSIEGLDRKPEENPFAPVGIKAGTFILRPTLEQGITATSNADSSFNGSSALLSETTLRLNATSDWRENSASADGYLTYRKTLSGQEVQDVRGRVDGTLNIDLSHDLRAIAKLGYEAAPESASSPVIIGDTVSQPLRQTFDASLGVEKDVGKARFGLTGAVEHNTYGDADLSSGGTLSQKDRDSTLYTATLRGGYEISPALTPFVELETGRRLYDQRIDDSGYERSATRLGARAGVEVDMGEKLSGEFSAGWLREAIDDDRLQPVSGGTLNADLRWSPERGTTIGLSGKTTVEGTTTSGESGSLLYSGRVSLERQIRDNLTANAALGADWRDYVGSDGRDLTLSAEASLTWWLNRYAGLTTRARTEKLTSNLPGREATTNSIFLGLKLQR